MQITGIIMTSKMKNLSLTYKFKQGEISIQIESI